MKGVTIILAAAGATLAGAAIALLFAPRKGTETRKQIKDYMNSLVEKGEVKLEEYAEAVKNCNCDK